MHDTELYRQLLGLVDPWKVERVELQVPEQRVDVWVGYPKWTRFPCPVCQTVCTIFDHQERTWRHLDSCQFQTRMHCRVPRIECPAHGSRFNVQTGQITGLPAVIPARVYPVTVEGDDVYVEV